MHYSLSMKSHINVFSNYFVIVMAELKSINVTGVPGSELDGKENKGCKGTELADP